MTTRDSDFVMRRTKQDNFWNRVAVGESGGLRESIGRGGAAGEIVVVKAAKMLNVQTERPGEPKGIGKSPTVVDNEDEDQEEGATTNAAATSVESFSVAAEFAGNQGQNNNDFSSSS